MNYVVWKYEADNSPWPLFLDLNGGWTRKLRDAKRFTREDADRKAQEVHGGTHIILE